MLTVELIIKEHVGQAQQNCAHPRVYYQKQSGIYTITLYHIIQHFVSSILKVQIYKSIINVLSNISKMQFYD